MLLGHRDTGKVVSGVNSAINSKVDLGVNLRIKSVVNCGYLTGDSSNNNTLNNLFELRIRFTRLRLNFSNFNF